MMYGFTYRGRHSSEFGLVMNTKSRPAMPPMREEDATVPYNDGAVDYSNAGGRVYYDDRIIDITLTVIKKELSLTQTQIARIVSWLSGWYDNLIFDDMPTTIWTARPVDLGDISVSLYRIGQFSVQFRCKPFNRFTVDMSTPITIGSDVTVGTEVPVNYGETSTFELSEGEQILKYDYMGDAPTRPIIIITGSVSVLSIGINGHTIKLNKVFKELKIDCSTWTSEADGIDVTAFMVGDYPELLPGKNEIVVNCDAVGTLKLDGALNFLYGFNGGY